MSALDASRRHADIAIIAFFALALAIPCIALLAGGDADVAGEQRIAAAAPERPRSVGDWRKFTAAVDAFVDDRFVLRRRLVQFRTSLAILLGERRFRNAAIGSDGYIYAPMSETSEIYRRRVTASDPRLGTAIDHIAYAADRLVAAGLKVFIVIAPEKGTMVPEHLPGWATSSGPAPPLSDLALALLRQKTRATVVDLRPALLALKSRAQIYYRSDTHWTQDGAFAAWEAIGDAMRRQGIAIAPLSPADLRHDPVLWAGDLIGYIGLAADKEEPVAIPRPAGQPSLGPRQWLGDYNKHCLLPPGAPAELPAGCVQEGAGGPAIALLADSFSMLWLQAVRGRTRASYWISHDRGAVDLAPLIRARPDAVVFQVAERNLLLDLKGDYGRGHEQAQALTLAGAPAAAAIRRPGAPAVTIAANAVWGHFDFVMEEAGAVHIQGWAFSPGAAPVPVTVVLFRGERGLHQAAADIQRPDVARVLGQPHAVRSGFSLTVAARLFAECADRGPLRLVGLSADGQASYLAGTPAIQAALARLQAAAGPRC